MLRLWSIIFLVSAGINCSYGSLVLRNNEPPSSKSKVGDVTLLYNNDLSFADQTQHKSVLLLMDSKTNQAASEACSILNEKLLPINQTFFTQELPSMLNFQVFENYFSTPQVFFVASKGNVCQAVDIRGRVTPVSCFEELPALCSQSSPFQGTASSTNKFSVSSSGLNITGFRDQLSFRFQGIPYANPFERWTYASLYSGSPDIDATQFGSVCVQSDNQSGNEDCLFLNIWTPFLPSDENTVSESKLKAVMFWIHGGAFTSGTGADPTFDGGNMASRGDVVVVTINYRLSTIGFLALQDGKTNGNFGIADQVVALEWVQKHIKAFGGDPNRITVFGQSAGAGSVRALMASPKSIGKFAAAIPQSNLVGFGFASTYSFYFTIEQEVEMFASKIINATGCGNSTDVSSQLACLKNVSAQELVDMSTVASFIVVDGTFITSHEIPLNRSGPVANVHLLSGNMRDDGAAFIGFPKVNQSESAFLASQGLPTNVTTNTTLFPLPPANSTQSSIFNTSARVTTEGEFRCLGQATIFAGLKHNLFKSVWVYEFNRSYQTPGFDPNPPNCDAPVTPSHPNGDPSGEYYKCHSGELFYEFGSLPSNLPFRDENDLPFMQQTLDTWTSFARTFNPNPDQSFLRARGFTSTAEEFQKLSPWEQATLQNINHAPIRELQVPSVMIPLKDLDQCDFLGFPLDFFV